MGNNRSKEKIVESDEQKETNCIISVEDYYDHIHQMMNKMFVIYWGIDAIKENTDRIDAFIFNSENTFDGKIHKIFEFEDTVISFFKKYDKHNYNRLWKDYIKEYFNHRAEVVNQRTGTINPRLMILLIDSFIDDKYNEVTFGPEELAKQSQNISWEILVGRTVDSGNRIHSMREHDRPA